MAKCSKCGQRKRKRVIAKMRYEGCDPNWGCGKKLPLPSLDLAHLHGLGMGADRNDDEDPRNDMDNQVLLCRECHRNQEAAWRKFVYLWKQGKVEWMEPKFNQAKEFWEALGPHL